MGRSDRPNALDLVDGRPAVDDVTVLLPSRVEAHAVFQVLELRTVRVDRGLFTALDGLRLLPVRLLLEPGMKCSCTTSIHDVKNKCSWAVLALSMGLLT